MEIEVKGHSGCAIEIHKEEKNLYIYKSTEDPKYVSRLLKQAKKQRKACELEYQHIRIPSIFDVQNTENTALIKMEYVYSKNFIEYFEIAGHEQISYFIKALCLFVEKELLESPMSEIDSSVILDKFFDVKEKVNSNALLKGDSDIIDLMTKSEYQFLLLKNLRIKLPVGTCHGDLTFSNILFNGNNYYLIDFLDSFVESPLLDIVKIRQDSAHLWSQLMYIHPFDSIRLKIVSQKIDEEINSYFSKFEWYEKYYKIFQLMNMLRILQYAHEEKVIKYLKSVIKEILNEL